MPVLDPDALGLEALARLALTAVNDGNWPLVLALALVAAVWLVRKTVAPKVPFLASDVGGGLLALAGGVTGAVASALLGGGVLSAPLLLAGLKVGFMAAGGWSTLKRLAVWALPKLKALATKVK
jgi:hypothetical protein